MCGLGKANNGEHVLPTCTAPRLVHLTIYVSVQPQFEVYSIEIICLFVRLNPTAFHVLAWFVLGYVVASSPCSVDAGL